jgi:hypothetical protein
MTKFWCARERHHIAHEASPKCPECRNLASATALESQFAQLKPDPQPGRAQDGAAALLPDETEAAKTESSFSVFDDLHFGQATDSSAVLTSSSNFAPQSAQRYSNNGIYFSCLLSSDMTAPVTNPRLLVSQGLHMSCQVEPNAV